MPKILKYFLYILHTLYMLHFLKSIKPNKSIISTNQPFYLIRGGSERTAPLTTDKREDWRMGRRLENGEEKEQKEQIETWEFILTLCFTQDFFLTPFSFYNTPISLNALNATNTPYSLICHTKPLVFSTQITHLLSYSNTKPLSIFSNTQYSLSSLFSKRNSLAILSLWHANLKHINLIRNHIGGIRRMPPIRKLEEYICKRENDR